MERLFGKSYNFAAANKKNSYISAPMPTLHTIPAMCFIAAAAGGGSGSVIANFTLPN